MLRSWNGRSVSIAFQLIIFNFFYVTCSENSDNEDDIETGYSLFFNVDLTLLCNAIDMLSCHQSQVAVFRNMSIDVIF